MLLVFDYMLTFTYQLHQNRLYAHSARFHPRELMTPLVSSGVKHQHQVKTVTI